MEILTIIIPFEDPIGITSIEIHSIAAFYLKFYF